MCVFQFRGGLGVEEGGVHGPTSIADCAGQSAPGGCGEKSVTGRIVDIPSLDGLRAFSFLVVFVAHAGAGNIVPGGFGVTVFFVLSGYLITTLLRLEFERTSTLSIRGFYVRRTFRILPLFYVVLTLVVIGTVWFGLGTGTVDPAATLAQYGHVTNYWAIFVSERPVMQGTGVYWSLAVEEHFYLIFPVFLLVMLRMGLSRKQIAAALLGICAAVLCWRCVLVFGMNVGEDRTYYATDTRIDSILFGSVLALARNPMLDRPISPRALRRGAVVALIVILGTVVVRNEAFRESLRYTVQSASIVAIIAFVIAVPESSAGRVLNWRPVVTIGRLSFGLYLVHQVVIIEFGKHLSPWPSAILAAATSLLIAAFLYRLVELPALQLRSRLTHARKAFRWSAGCRDVRCQGRQVDEVMA